MLASHENPGSSPSPTRGGRGRGGGDREELEREKQIPPAAAAMSFLRLAGGNAPALTLRYLTFTHFPRARAPISSISAGEDKTRELSLSLSLAAGESCLRRRARLANRILRITDADLGGEEGGTCVRERGERGERRDAV